MKKKLGLFSVEISRSIKNQYTKFEAEVDQESIIERLKFAEQLFPQKLFILCPVSHPTIRYVSQSSRSVIGFDSEEIMQKTLHEFMNLIHADDLPGFLRCLEFVKSKEPLDPLQHRILIYYRIMHRSGHYLHICDEKIALKSASGKYVYMSILHDISNEVKFNSVGADVLKRNNHGYSKIYSYKPHSTISSITPRESEIITMIGNGFSNSEIAEKLHVSINTIKNHKQTLFKKINVKTSIELAHVMRHHNAV